MSFIPLSKADMDKLEKERKEIERRRNAEAKRAKYFFNEKQRGMGIDVDFIKTQITEKAATKKEEKNKDVSYKKEIESFVDRLADLDEKRQIFGKEKAFKVGEHQRMSKMEDRDTFYLNDPLMIKKDLPPRMNDAQYIPSCCLQKFDGEDLSKSQRVKKQQKEIENWSKQIIDEKKKNEQNEQEMTQKYIQQRNAHFEQLNAVQMAKEKAMKMKKVQIANANLAKMQQTEHKKEENKAMDLRKSVSEINKMKESAFLNEAWSSTLRNDNNDRFIPYNFKGFSQNQRQKILNQQSEQIQQHLEDKNDEKKKNEEFNKEQQNYSRSSLLQLRNAQRFKQEQKMKLAQIHKPQIKEMEIKTNETNKIYQNEVTPKYFEQFQTSTR